MTLWINCKVFWKVQNFKTAGDFIIKSCQCNGWGEQDNERVYSVFCIFHACVVTYWPFHSKTKWNITITLFVSIASINILTEMPKMTTAKLQWTNPLQLLMEKPPPANKVTLCSCHYEFLFHCGFLFVKLPQNLEKWALLLMVGSMSQIGQRNIFGQYAVGHMIKEKTQ